MRLRTIGWGLGRRGLGLLGAAALALAGLGPAWLASPAPAGAASHPTGGVVAWGDGSAGQTRVPPDARSGVISVAAGCAHSLALRADGRVVAWGDDSYGQTDVPAAAQSGVVAIVAGCNHNIAIKSNGTLVAWGDNRYGQTNVPALPKGWRWTNIGAGDRHSVGVARYKSAADIYVWGDNTYGQLDIPPSDSDSVSLVDLHDVADVEAGGDQTVARLADGTVVLWGGAFASVVPPAVSDVVNQSVGRTHALLLRKNGTVVAVGSGSQPQEKVPAGLHGVTAVAAGGYHSLALLSSGKIVAWGSNDAGQSSAPPRSNSRFIWIAAGLRHSLAVGQLVPDAPKSVTVTPWDGAVTVSWTPPEDPGYTAVTLYTVTAAPAGGGCTAVASSSCTIGGLDNGVSYTFSVTARNAVGIGPAAVSLPVVPAVPPLVTPTPEPALPTALPSPTPAAPPASNGGGGGGLPLPVLVGIAALIGLGVALVAYDPKLLVARAGEVAGRLNRGSAEDRQPREIGADAAEDWLAPELDDRDPTTKDEPE
jgi:hypothetical protein